MCDHSNTIENYGDVHLHYDAYPDYDGTHSGQCKWDGSTYSPGSLHISEEPLYPQRCPTEYCHPGTWQGTNRCQCGGVKVSAEVPPSLPVSMPSVPYGGFLMKVGGFLLAVFVIYMLKKRLLK